MGAPICRIGAKKRIVVKDDFQKIVLDERRDFAVLLRVASRLDELQNSAKCASRPVMPAVLVSYTRQWFSSLRVESDINIDTKLSAIGVSKLNSGLRSIHANFLSVDEKYEKFKTANRRLSERLTRRAYPTAFLKYM